MDTVTYFQETNRGFAEDRRELGSETSNWTLLLKVDSDERTGHDLGAMQGDYISSSGRKICAPRVRKRG